MTEKHTCPRRVENGMDDPTSPFKFAGRDLDTWTKRDGARSCSYCGSLHPDDFMEWARTGAAELGPTDKNYKVYVQNPDITYRPTSGSSDDRDEDGRIIMRPIGPRATAHLKFYFQHLSHEQRSEFIALYNARPVRHYADTNDDPFSYTVDDPNATGMQVGYPGYFYTLPFFAGR